MRTLIVLLAVFLLASAWDQPFSGKAGKYSVSLDMNPSKAVVGANTFTIKVEDGDKPLKGADVGVHLDMPSMSMPADATVSPGDNDGEYIANATFGMGGTYKVTVSVAAMAGMTMDGDGKYDFTLDVKDENEGSDTGASTTTGIDTSTTGGTPEASNPATDTTPATSGTAAQPGEKAPAAPTTPAPAENPFTPQMIGWGAAVLLVVVVILILALRKKKESE